MERQQRKLWTKMDILNRVFFYKKNVWRYVYSIKSKNMVQEMMLKASLYNKSIIKII
jgi:hypothetical protein